MEYKDEKLYHKIIFRDLDEVKFMNCVIKDCDFINTKHVIFENCMFTDNLITGEGSLEFLYCYVDHLRIRDSKVKVTSWHSMVTNTDIQTWELLGTHVSSEGVVSLYLNPYIVTMAPDYMSIGCQRWTYVEWWGLDDSQIKGMGGDLGLRWWNKWRNTLQHIAESGGYYGA